jgi:hypothetical protein
MSRFAVGGLLLAVALLVIPAAASAAPILIGSTTYTAIGTTELVNAPFTQPDGGFSLNSYEGLVEVKVWGTGEARTSQLNDAFYVFTDPAHNAITPIHQGSYYSIAFDNDPLVPFNPAQLMTGFIAYDVDAGTAVTGPYVPGYRADHTYTFVIDTGLLSPEVLHFGVSDGIFSDNAGSYHIQLTQLQPVPVPEPGSLVLLGTGLAVGVMRWRRRGATARTRAV